MSDLGDLLSLEYGEPLPSEIRTGHGYPVFGSNGEVGRHDSVLIEGPGIIVGRKGSAGKVCWTDESFWPIDTTYWVKCESDDQRWLYWLLSHLPLSRLGSSTGVPGLNRNDAYTLRVFEPPGNERRKIAMVLDTLETSIRQTEAIIEKLKLVKQGLLHDLLTRGIGANGELRPPQSEAPHLYKDSPLGRIPQEWTAMSIRDVASLVTSGSRGWADHYTEAGALFLRSQNVRMGNLDFSDRQHVLPPSGAEGARTKLTGSDLLITITGNGVGNVACVPAGWTELAFVSQHVGLVRLHDSQLAQLTMHYLVDGAPGHQQLIDAQYGQSKPGLSLENLRKLSIPIPPDEEQQMIIQRIHAAQDRGAMEQRYALQLRAMKEGLMGDLLTGRVRVTPLLDVLETQS